MLRITFGQPRDTTSPGTDGKSFDFPFTALRFADAPAGDPETAHVLKVLLVRERVGQWGYSEGELPRVLFTFVLEEVKLVARAMVLPPSRDLVLTTLNTPRERPVSPEQAPEPEGYVLPIPHSFDLRQGE